MSTLREGERLSGYIYFIEAGEYVKIGYTTSIKIRLSALQVGCPHTLRLRRIVPGTPADESWLHETFTDSLYRGEWFYLDKMMQTAIRLLEGCESVRDLGHKVEEELAKRQAA